MFRRYGSFLFWILGAFIIIAAFYVGTARLWKATEEARAASLEKNVVSSAMGDIAEGNLIRFGATLSKLQREGQIRFAQILHVGRDNNVLFRTAGHASANDTALRGFDCQSPHRYFNTTDGGIGLVTVLPTKIAGGQCDVLQLVADMPQDLSRFKDRLVSTVTLFVAAIFIFFSFITIIWHRRVLQLEVQNSLIHAERDAAVGRMAAQVAHDIRSPLAALEVAAGALAQLPENKRILIRAAVSRIRDIANSLQSQQRAQAVGDAPEAPGAASPRLLSSLIDPVVSEKRMQFRSQPRVEIELRLDASSYGLFAAVQTVEFKRMISNLVNNAVEAIGDGSGAVNVTLSVRDGRAMVSVQDNGKGIPPEVLAKLGRRGESHGKTGGSGLGLFHARTSAESWGGSLEISSEFGKGTTTTVLLPLAPAPEWFVPELRLIPEKAVVILDDDASIHQVWQGRLDALKAGGQRGEVVHVASPDELRRWIKGEAAKARQALYLFDYELLGYPETGLSLAEELSLGERMVLVTSRYDEPEVLAGCRRLKARLIPKGLAGLVPIRIEAAAEASERERLDAVLIDDDALTRMLWENAASDLGKNLRTFATPQAFFKAAGRIDRATPVYVDSNLGNGIEGGEESLRVHALGFEEVYLATGHPPETFSKHKHLRAVVGKAPPWGA